MQKSTLLKSMILRQEILVMPGAYDPISARLIERAGFEAVQCTGLGITAAALGLPDFSVIGMSDMAARTARIVRATALPVMADGDNGFGNAVNTFLTVQEFEAVGIAGINLEDQQQPKRCGHLDGKQIISTAEMVQKIRAAAEARQDSDLVINARTDSLALGGVEEVLRRGNAYLEAGADMVFVDGVDNEDYITRLVRGVRGPIAVNMVEGGKTPPGSDGGAPAVAGRRPRQPAGHCPSGGRSGYEGGARQAQNKRRPHGLPSRSCRVRGTTWFDRHGSRARNGTALRHAPG